MKNRNKAATAATAVVLSAALLMTGTFAWNDFSQKKLNELAGVLNYDVALVEDFEETSDWSFANPDVNKDVSAANKGDNAAYVRINLREYLQVRPFTYTNDSYVKDAEGNPVRFAVDKNGEYIPSTAADPKAFGAVSYTHLDVYKRQVREDRYQCRTPPATGWRYGRCSPPPSPYRCRCGAGCPRIPRPAPDTGDTRPPRRRRKRRRPAASRSPIPRWAAGNFAGFGIRRTIRRYPPTR